MSLKLGFENNMRRSIRSFNTPPSSPKPGNPQAFDRVSYLTGREFEPCLVGVGNLNRSCYVCLAEYTFYLLIWGYLKQTVHFREQLTLKNRSTRKPRSLSRLLRKKRNNQIRHSGRDFEYYFGPRDGI